MGDSRPFHVVEDEEAGCFLVVPAGDSGQRRVVARAERESAAWLIAAALPAALLRDEPWIFQAGEAEDVFFLREGTVSTVELAGLGVHVLRDPVQALASVTHNAQTLAGLLRAAPPEVLEQALSQVGEPKA